MVNGRYYYMADLLELEATATGLGPANLVLADHPDSIFATYILNGITRGFHIGAKRPAQLISSHSNMPSVRQQHQLIAAQISEEKAAGRVIGPLPPHLASRTHTNPIGLIPKPHQPGRGNGGSSQTFPPQLDTV